MSLETHTAPEKVDTLEGLAKEVADGDCLAVGGGLSAREPMALIRAILRRKVSNLKVVGSAHGIDVDLLCGAGAVSVSAESYVGFEQDFGMAPNYRRGCEAGEIKIEDNCCYTLVQQLRAAIAGLPFMPLRSIRGTDMTQIHGEYKTMTCPFSDDELILAPALSPDVAILHAQYGDAHGNLRIEGPPVADILFAKASKKVLATVERLVSNEELRQLGGANIPYFYVNAVAEVPMGAHPTSCYPFYLYDRPHTESYMAAAKGGAEAFQNDYLQPFVFDCSDHAAYLEAIGGGATRKRLESWQDGTEAWKKLYQREASQ
jgi:glutaconate CoA-transferase, subunit A